MRALRRAPADTGLTLLEMVIALAVLGVLLVGLTQGVRAGLALRHAQIAQVDRTAEFDPTMRLLRRLLTRLPMSPAGTSVLTTAAGLGFSGETDRVTFIGELPDGLGAVRRAEMTLYVRDRRLVLAWLPHRHEHSLAPPAAPQETPLLEGVEQLRLAYWGTLGNGQAAAWQPRWRGLMAPELVRLRLIFGQSDRRRWPDLLAAPQP